MRPASTRRRGRRTALRMALTTALLVALTGVALAQPSRSGGRSQDLVIKAPRALVMDVASGAILAQRNIDELVPPASMSKLMTLAVVFRAMTEGRLRPTDEFKMSVNAWRKGGAPSGTAAMMVPVNTRISLEELLQGIVVQSGNDACIAIAEGIAGTEQAFAALMEGQAREIGLKRSTFRNATGLPHEEQLMSVREIALLARHVLLKWPEHAARFAQREFRYRRHKFINRNPLLGVDGVDGMKTGHLKAAGYGIVLTAKQNERRLLVVVAGAPTAETRKLEAARLLDWGFKNVSDHKLFESGEVVGRARVWGGTSFYVPLVGAGEIKVVLPRYPANQRLKAEILYQGPLKPPIRRGDQVAVLRVVSTAQAQNDLPLYAAEEVQRAGMVRRGIDSLWHLATRWIP